MVTSKYVKSCQIYEFAKAILSKLYNGNSYRNIQLLSFRFWRKLSNNLCQKSYSVSIFYLVCPSYLHNRSWPQALITGPAENHKSNSLSYSSNVEMAYIANSQTGGSISRPDNLKRSFSQRPLETPMNLQAQFRANGLSDTKANYGNLTKWDDCSK